MYHLGAIGVFSRIALEFFQVYLRTLQVLWVGDEGVFVFPRANQASINMESYFT